MALRKVVFVLFGIQLALMAVLGVCSVFLYQNQVALDTSQDIYLSSYLLADELRQSSDDLTRLARTYVATGNEEFEREYWAVLDIRNGRMPRPVDYSRIYWDFVAATGLKPRPDGNTVSLRDLMVKVGFTEAEFAKLREAERNSDELVKTERIAMNAVKGLFADSLGRFTVVSRPDREMAIRIMNDDAYHKAKAGIMRPIDEFYQMFVDRTAREVQNHQERSRQLLWGIIALIGTTLAAFWYSFVTIRRQIVRREQAEEARRSSEKRFRESLEQIRLIAVELDAKGRILFCNDFLSELTGWTRDEIIGRDWFSIFIPEHEHATMRPVLQEIVQTGTRHLRYENPILTKAGELRQVRWNNTVLRSTDSRIASVVGLGEDVTERKEMETKLLQQTEKYRGIFENSVVPVSTVDRQGRFVDFNQACLDMLGYTREELLSMSIHDLAVDRDLAKVIFQRLLSGKAMSNVEHRAMRKDGTVLTVLNNSRPLLDLSGAVVGMQSTLVDITDRKREQAVAAARSRILQYSATKPTRELLKAVLDEAEVMTDSSIGFFHFLEEDGKTISLQQWSTRTVTEFCTAEGQGSHYDLGKAGVWADCIRERRPIICNDYDSLQHRRGMPPGHARVQRFLSIPLIRGARIVAIIGVGNKARPYTEADAEIVTRLADLCWEGIERIRTNDALLASEERYKLITNQSPVAIGLHRDGKFIHINPAGVQLFHASSADEIVGHSVLDRVHPDYRAKVTERVRKAQVEGIRAELEEEKLICIDGAVIDAEVRGVAVEFQGEPAMLVFVTDITERKRIDEELRRSEQLLTLSLECQREVTLFSIDQDLRYLYFNKTHAERMKQYYDTAIDVGMNILECVTADEDRDSLQQLYRRALNGESFTDVRTYGALGRRSCEGFYNPLRNAQNEVIGVTVLSIDITERIRAEEERIKFERQIQQTQKLESLGVLSGGIAHDFNNILMVVLGNAELALGDISPESTAKESISQIVTAAQRAAELCRQMMAYSGKASFVKEPIDLAALIEEMGHLLRTSISKKATIAMNLAPDLPTIHGDPSQLRQIVMNLIINASDALGDQTGEIAVAASRQYCDKAFLNSTRLEDELPAGWYVCLEVTDTGCGMDAETQTRIFEPFFTTKFTGRGLGLSAVLGIVKTHRAALTLFSQLHKGTTFKIFFPATEIVHETVPGSDTQVPGLRPHKGGVLLVDDEPMLLTLGQKMLDRLGFEVLTATDGCEAIELYKARGSGIDVIILDMTMPNMGGYDTFCELSRLNPNVRVVIASGHTVKDVSESFKDKRPAGYLQKPFTVGKLKEILTVVMPIREPVYRS